ncbi:fused DSP-PTPase phosphatase/NAD kinase-like protein [Pseudoxanthomonas dokdonensis]|uniref:DSP-PTPase phosphatase fused to NAD+ Kinase domain-containing protein n=1 Tax=Pseudoxanthomonas dokdonensis TaxID=344882 RepID=A0A0R0CEZ1_9GAMM|nr:sulfur transferase domain-containing protein [Pseudoxanthomonas dokdonensis]KRG68365.1 hypothetical protein ABB29_13690 [Pseudoxanthomonas dokdonensis]
MSHTDQTRIRLRPWWLLLCLLAASANLPASQPTLLQPGLYTGGQPSAAQLRDLAGKGVATVIDLRAPEEERGIDEASIVPALGMQYVSLPIGSAEDINNGNARALQRLLDDSQGPILLHCASGNRVGALLALIAAEKPGEDAESALRRGKAAGLGSLEPIVRQRLGLPPIQP